MLLSAGLLKEPPWKTVPLLYDEQEQDNKGLECTSIIILSSGPNHEVMLACLLFCLFLELLRLQPVDRPRQGKLFGSFNARAEKA